MLAVALLLVLAAPPDDASSAAPSSSAPSPSAPSSWAPSSAAPSSAAPSSTAPKGPASDKVLVLDVAGDIDPREGRGLADALAALLHERTLLAVTPASAMRDLLSLEADRALAGCDDGSCAAEAAGAIGARFVVLSRHSLVGGQHLLRIEAFDGQEARSVSIVTIRGDSIASLATVLGGAVDELVARSDGVLPGREAPAAIIEAPSFFERPGNTPLTAAAVIGALSVLGAVAYAVPVSFMVGRLEGQEQAIARYEEAPGASRAQDVVDARARVLEVQPLHTLTQPLVLLAPLGIVAAGALLVLGLQEKAE